MVHYLPIHIEYNELVRLQPFKKMLLFELLMNKKLFSFNKDAWIMLSFHKKTLRQKTECFTDNSEFSDIICVDL